MKNIKQNNIFLLQGQNLFCTSGIATQRNATRLATKSLFCKRILLYLFVFANTAVIAQTNVLTSTDTCKPQLIYVANPNSVSGLEHNPNIVVVTNNNFATTYLPVAKTIDEHPKQYLYIVKGTPIAGLETNPQLKPITINSIVVPQKTTKLKTDLVVSPKTHPNKTKPKPTVASTWVQSSAPFGNGGFVLYAVSNKTILPSTTTLKKTIAKNILSKSIYMVANNDLMALLSNHQKHLFQTHETLLISKPYSKTSRIRPPPSSLTPQVRVSQTASMYC